MTAPSTLAQLSGPRGRGAAPHRARRSFAGFLFAVPALVLFLLFAIYPGIQVFGLSLFDYSLTSPPEFVGFDNFAFLSSDPRFGEALLQTVFYAVGTYGPALVLALILAQALSTRIRGHGARPPALLPAARDELGGGLDHLAGRAASGRDAERDPAPGRELADQLGERALGARDHEHLEGDRVLPDPLPRRALGDPDRRLRGGAHRRRRRLAAVLVHDPPAAAPGDRGVRDHGGAARRAVLQSAGGAHERRVRHRGDQPVRLQDRLRERPDGAGLRGRRAHVRRAARHRDRAVARACEGGTDHACSPRAPRPRVCSSAPSAG